MNELWVCGDAADPGGHGSLQHAALAAGSARLTVGQHLCVRVGHTRGVGLDDTADVKPGYLITEPSSFQQVSTLPAAEGSSALQLTVTYELLIQSAPDSKTYLRQATSDSFQVPLVT